VSEAIWEYPVRMRRSEPLSREVIVHAAMAYVDEHDLGTLSTRGLAAQLGVTPMALYRYVRNKDELLDAVVEELLARIRLPRRSGTDWRRWLEAIAQSLRRLFVEHPVAISAFARGPVTTPTARRRLEQSVEMLTAAGFTPDEAVKAYAAVHTYTVGFSTLEATRRSNANPRDLAVPVAELDSLHVSIHQFVSDDQFTYGLRALLSGLTPSASV
jgi:AcrR family transcriptional regulator